MRELVCIICPNGCRLNIYKGEEGWIIKGNLCPKGVEFAVKEMTEGKRSLCTTVKTIYSNMPRLSVRTDGEIPKKFIFPLMKKINKVVVKTPVHTGDIILKNVFDTGVNIIATSDLYSSLEYASEN